MQEDKINCFVIMPFSKTKNHTEEFWTNHFNNFLKPLIEEIPKIFAHRSEPLRGDVLKQIITDLIISPIVIADLTDKNVNVFWELGVRQSFKHGTITIAEEGTELPFDVFAKATLKYNTKNSLKINGFREQFKKAIQDCLSHPDSPDSHVIETLSGRGTMFEIFHRDESIRRLDAVLSECDSNLKVLNALIGACTKNKNKSWLDKFKLNEKIYFNTQHFSTIAIELLVTHRYLNENTDFYKMAENYLLLFAAMNRQNDNFTYRDSAEEFILKNKELSYWVIMFFRHELETARNKLNKLV